MARLRLRIDFEPLGAATRVEKLEVQWPSGALETFNVPGVDRLLTLVEGKGSTRK